MKNAAKRPYKRPKTPKRGAADERAADKRHIKNMPGISLIIEGTRTQWIRRDLVLEWIDTRPSRNRDQEGGL